MLWCPLHWPAPWPNESFEMSKQDLSEDTKVILLLCGRFGGEKQEPYQPLTTKDYGELARWLKERQLRPSDLMTEAGHDTLSGLLEAGLERKRVEFLLGRGTAMALALERWARGGLWVISRADAEFPQRLKDRLKKAAPPLLYGAGDKALLEMGGLAIIGSRDASESALAYTRSVAARCAKEGMAVVSGGARGVDAAAMQGATEGGGYCIGVLASDLLKSGVNRQNRIGLQEGQLVLVSPFYPEAGFNAGNAMGRNRYIYTLADQALVIDSALRSGGTWAGAVENLKQKWVPLFVRTPGEAAGNAALVEDGGLPFNLPEDSTDTLTELFATQVVENTPSGRGIADVQQSFLDLETVVPEDVAVVAPVPPPAQQELATLPEPQELAISDIGKYECDGSDVSGTSIDKPLVSEEPVTVGRNSTLDMYADFSAKLASLLTDKALSEDEISIQLCIEKSQAKAWLRRASEAGFVEKLKRPVRYAMGCNSSLC